MKVVIFGANGMLGHKLLYYLGKNEGLDVTGTVRTNSIKFPSSFNKVKFRIINFDCKNEELLDNIIQENNVLINAIGVIKQRKGTSNEDYWNINGYFPHKLAVSSALHHKKLIHISTDCVFSGNQGNYSEEDIPDPIDVYGLSKAMGEIRYGNNLTIRTSIIGTELNGKYGLLEWIRNTKEESIKGYKKALWSGVTTDWLSKVIAKILIDNHDLKGLYNFGLKYPIDKYSVLKLLNKKFKLEKHIEEDYKVVIDRSLNSELFFKRTKIQRSSIHKQILDIIDLNEEL